MVEWICVLAAAMLLVGEVYCGDDDEVAICKREPVQLDYDFISCCKGKPSFSSEQCIDSLTESKTLSQECFVDCLYREFGIYNGSAIDMEAVHNLTATFVNDQDIFMQAFDYCSQKGDETLRKMFAFAEVKSKFDCDLVPAYMDMCVWYHTLSFCPEERLGSNPECTPKMQWVNECLLK